MPQTPQQAEVGTIVHYKLGREDVTRIQQLREQFAQSDVSHMALGNDVEAGMIYPAIIVSKTGPERANLQVFVDGPDTLWTSGKSIGSGEGAWQLPQFSQVGQGQGTQQTAGQR